MSTDRRARWISNSLWGAIAAIVSTGMIILNDNLARQRTDIIEFRHALGDYAQDLRSRYTEATMVASTITRGDKGGADFQELKARKRVYDDAFRRFSSNIDRHILRMSPILSRSEEGRIFKYFLEESLRTDMKALDMAITEAYGHAVYTEELDKARWMLKKNTSMDTDYEVLRNRIDRCFSTIRFEIDLLYRDSYRGFWGQLKRLFGFSPSVDAEALQKKLNAVCKPKPN